MEAEEICNRTGFALPSIQNSFDESNFENTSSRFHIIQTNGLYGLYGQYGHHIDTKPKSVFDAQPFLAFNIFSWKHTKVNWRKYG